MTLFTSSSAQPITLSGDQVAIGDVPANTIYTRRATAGDPGTKIRLGGISVRTLLLQNSVDPDAITFVNITRADGGQVTLRRADLADPPPFAEGPALFSDDGSATRFFRPVRGRYGTNAKDEVVATADSGPLQVYVDGGDIPVTASATPLTVKTGETVTFTARVSFRPPGARLTLRVGLRRLRDEHGQRHGHAQVRQPRQQAGARLRARPRRLDPAVRDVLRRHGRRQRAGRRGADAAHDDADDARRRERQPAGARLLDGHRRRRPGRVRRQRRRNGHDADRAQAVGRRAGEAQAAKPPPPKEPFGVTISGVLINDTGETVRKLPSGAPAGAPKGEQESSGGKTDRALEIPVSAVLALAVICLGALRERRGVKLRLA